jgi:hypothetical protein
MFRSTVLLLAFASCLASWTVGQEPVGSASDLPRWVTQLDADRFVVREAAMANLIQAGEPAVDPVAAAVSAGGLETIARGLTVLRELALGDGKASQRAQQAIQRIAGTQATAAAQQASLTLRSLESARQTRGLSRLRSLGASISEEPQVLNVPRGPQIYVQIDERWRGETGQLRYVAWLTGFPAIHVTLQGDRITDQSLAMLRDAENVTSLLISRANVSDEGLRFLADMPQLQFLSLRYLPLTDAAIVHLEKLQRAQPVQPLAALQIYGTQLTHAGLAQLGQSLASTEIDERLGGGFLGIGPALNNNGGCVVGRVEPEQAADRAGLQVGDIIVAYDDKKVEDFTGLTRLIGGNAPGDRIQLTILRNGMQVEKEVTLGEWP